MDCLSNFDKPKKFDKEHAKKVRTLHLKNTLNTSEKKELYNCGTIAGKLKDLINIINEKKYPLYEECSAAGNYWTVLHYAAHNGYTDIVEYVLKYYSNHPNKVDILNLQSSLGLSPLLIALKNQAVFEKKKKVLDLYIEYDCIDFYICSKLGKDIFDICNAASMLPYLLSKMKED